MTFSIMTLNIMALDTEWCYAHCH